MKSEVRELLTEELNAFSAEKQALRCMQRALRKASAEALRQGIQMHIDQTQVQIERVEEAMEKMNVRPGRKVCEAMRGLVEEAQHEIEEHEEKGPILDLVIVAGMQRIELRDGAYLELDPHWLANADAVERALLREVPFAARPINVPPMRLERVSRSTTDAPPQGAEPRTPVARPLSSASVLEPDDEPQARPGLVDCAYLVVDEPGGKRDRSHDVLRHVGRDP